MFAQTSTAPRTLIMRIALVYLALALSTQAIQSCKSTEPSKEGVQSKYFAMNPSRILAVTPTVIAVPGDKNSIIDPVIVQTVPIIGLVEEKVLSAFKNQPSVNGVSFKAVRNALETSKSEAYSRLVKSLDSTLTTLKLPQRDLERKISEACRSRSKFSELYNFCLKSDATWKQGLNELSSTVLNADAALMVFITELQKPLTSKGSLANITIQVLLVDTNNGDLIWIRKTESTLPFAQDASPKERWASLIDQAFPDQFWAEFPGRKISPETEGQDKP